jgi:hypothetical protein
VDPGLRRDDLSSILHAKDLSEPRDREHQFDYSLSGNPGAEIGAPALDPRVRGGDDKWLVILNTFSVRYLGA